MADNPTCPNCGFPHQCRNAEMERNRLDAEDKGRAEAYLDGVGVPTHEDGERLSLVGRIKALQAVTPIRRQVEAFCRAGGHPVLDRPQVPPEDRVHLRVSLIMEEFFEFLQAVFPRLKELPYGTPLHKLRESVRRLKPHVDIVALADALADLDYVVEGTRLEFGIDGGPVAEEVQRSNMSKFGPGSWKREDGKIMKPPDWKPPDIKGELQKQGMEEPKPPPVRYPAIICPYCGERNCTRSHVA